MYVKGQQETTHGVSKALFLCEGGGKIMFRPMFSGGMPDNLMGGVTPRRLMLDEAVIDLAPYEIEPVRWDRGYVTATYILPRNIVAALLKTQKQIGYAVLATNPDLFYGFYMDFAPGRTKLSGFVAGCR